LQFIEWITYGTFNRVSLESSYCYNLKYDEISKLFKNIFKLLFIYNQYLMNLASK